MYTTPYNEYVTERVTGYILLAVGIAIIAFSAINVYMVFSKRVKPVQLFAFSGVSIDLGQMVGNQLPTGPLPKTELISPEFINESSNIFAHLLLMGFVVSVGHKLASLGTMMVRPIVVKAKS